MELGETITRWTVRLALLLAAAAIAAMLLAKNSPQRQPRLQRAARGLWTAGWVLFAGHVAAAFHHYHHWSHAHAYAETARQTREVVGLDWGGGLFVNYLFALAWLADVLWWWAAPATCFARLPRLHAAWYAFFLFIAFNGTVVFKAGPTRWVAFAVFAALAVLWANTARPRRE